MIGTQPWALEPPVFEALVRTLRFRYFKWDTHAVGRCLVLPESMVLPQAVHRTIVEAVEGLHAALARFERRVQRNSEALRRLGIPAALDPLIGDEASNAPEFARYDFFPTEDGRWMVSEFNEDVPGGFNEAVGVPDLLGTPGRGTMWAGDLRQAMANAFAAHEHVSMLYATAFSEDLQHMLILEQWLRAAGHTTQLASPAHLTRRFGRLRVLGHPVDAAFRFYPGEWMPRLPNFRTWCRVGGHLPMMNPLRHMVRQSKSVFAVWREDTGLSDDDRALVERHCPLTAPFHPRQVTQLRDERDRWVLKRVFGRMGDAVVIGALCTPAQWDETIAAAQTTPSEWCMQERFLTRTIPFASGALYPAVGAFVVNGRFAGYYSRAADRPLITHEAFHVATLVEAA